ncbi:MAG TPA: diguanylate cyclase [Rhodocyclaceae bacterium]
MRSPTLIHKFLRMFLPMVALAVAVVLVYGQGELERQISRLRNHDALVIGLGAGALAGRIETIHRDLAFLSASHSLREAINRPSAQHLAELAEDFVIFSRSKGVYDQIRWIDETGFERVRVELTNGQPELVPQERLQDKRQRYYFVATMALRPGEIFASPLDLNVEQNQIEVPYKPTLRLATPVADAQGRLRGIVIVNYLGRDLLETFDRETKALAGRSMLVNQDGYWLKGTTPDDEWGFMFDRSELSLAARYPRAWQHISSVDRGQVALEDGIWSWQTVRPFSSRGLTSVETITAQQHVWKAVSHLHDSDLMGMARTVWLRLSAVMLLLAAGVAYGCWKLVLAWDARAEADNRLRSLNVDLEATVESRTEALRLSERRFRDVAHISADWIWEVDAEARYVYASESVEELLGYRPEEIIGKTAFDLMPPDEARRVRVAFAEIAEARRPFRDLENIVLGKDGKAHITLTNGMPILGADGALLGYRGVDRDITAQRQMEQQIRQMAFIDGLTGLPNRRLFADRLEIALAASRRSGERGALLFLDLDKFKALNDRAGHEAGDLLLVEAARRLQGCVREMDTVARLGGDEFLIILGGLDADDKRAAEQVKHVAEKIAAAMGAPYLLKLADKTVEHHCTASIGATLFLGHEVDGEELLRRADAAMYEAKAAGRAAIRFSKHSP